MVALCRAEARSRERIDDLDAIDAAAVLQVRRSKVAAALAAGDEVDAVVVHTHVRGDRAAGPRNRGVVAASILQFPVRRLSDNNKVHVWRWPLRVLAFSSSSFEFSSFP
jgi:hypothetical protein